MSYSLGNIFAVTISLIFLASVIHPLYAQTANETSAVGSPMQQVQNNGIAASTSKTDVVSKIVGLCNQYQALCGTPICSSVAPSTGIDTASCMKALPTVRQFFNTHSASPSSTQPQPATASSIKTYQNSTYGITSLQYPSDWTINETNTQSSNGSSVDIVTFYAPVSSYPSNQHPPFVRISVDSPANNLASSLSSYLSYTLNSYSQGQPNYTTVNSNTTAKLAGFPAYSLEFSDINTDDNSTYRELELGTILSGAKVLFVDYAADTPTYSTLLPIALKMISSLRINESAVAQLAPPSSAPPSSAPPSSAPPSSAPPSSAPPSSAPPSSAPPSSPPPSSPPPPNSATSSPPTTPTYTSSYQTIPIFHDRIGLLPGELKGYSFSVPDNAKNIYLRGAVSASGGAINSITIKLYDASQCAPPDSEGRIDLGSCTLLLNNDYSTGEEIDKYIPHGGTFYLYLEDSSSFFNKIVGGNIYVEYLPG